jgi:hypothetical protein
LSKEIDESLMTDLMNNSSSRTRFLLATLAAAAAEAEATAEEAAAAVMGLPPRGEGNRSCRSSEEERKKRRGERKQYLLKLGDLIESSVHLVGFLSRGRGVSDQRSISSATSSSELDGFQKNIGHRADGSHRDVHFLRLC